MATMAPYASQNLYQRIKSRQGSYESRRGLYDAQNEVIVEHFRPDLVTGQVGQKQEGGFSSSRIIEGTGPYSAMVWQRGFLGNMVSRKSDWFRQQMKEPPRWTGVTFKGNDEVNQYTQNMDDHMSEVYRRSNYYDVLPQFVLDAGTVGSPVMLREQDPLNDRVICKVPDYAARWLDKDIFGRDNSLHVKWEWTALEAAEFFGMNNLPAAVRNQLLNGNHYDKTQYLQVIHGAGDPILEDLPGQKIPITHPWMEFFICLTAQANEQKPLKPLHKGPGYFSRPFSTWHYHRNWNEVYSRTMAWFAIYDVRGCNAMWEALFGEAELSVRPPVWALDTLRGLLDLAPGGEMYARDSNEYGYPPQFLDRKSRYQPAIDFTDRLKASIERWFHVPLFMMVNELASNRNQPETAYGLMRMEAERTGQLAPQVETFEPQVLGDNHDAFLDMERLAEPAYPWGRLPEPPEIVQAYSDGTVDVEFIGQLSMAQVRDRTITNFYRNIGTAELIFNAQPETIHKVRWAEALERVLEAGNFPQADLVPQEEYEAIIAAMRQRAMQQELAEAAPKLTQAVKNLGGAIEEKSPLKLLQGAAA